MERTFHYSLSLQPEQRAQLDRLGHRFAAACDRVWRIAQEHDCWARVRLHHLAYPVLRAEFADLGAQMACNAVYSVTRARTDLEQLATAGRVPPVEGVHVRFAEQAAIFFDRHTLSLKDGRVSMFTLDGRMRFDLAASRELETLFRAAARLREVVLRREGAGYALSLRFDTPLSASDGTVVTPEPVEAAA